MAIMESVSLGIYLGISLGISLGPEHAMGVACIFVVV